MSADAADHGAPLLDGEELRQLERLDIVHLGAVLHGLGGQRERSMGTRGLEFAGYRPYVPGDELRRVDWNIYARLREVFVKSAPDEGHVALSLLIDGSGSMGQDGGAASKFRYAQRLAATLAAVALLSGDAAETHLLDDGESWPGGRMATPASVVPLLEDLSLLRRGGRTDLPASVRSYRRRRGDTEVAVLISDGLAQPESVGEALEELAAAAQTATLVHVIDAAAQPPDLRGAVQLRDRETGELLLVQATPELRRRYAEGAAALAERVRAAARDAGVGYLRAPLDAVPLDLLARAAAEAELVAFASGQSNVYVKV